MNRYEPEGWTPIDDHYVKVDPDSPVWPRCARCGRAVAHHVTRFERFLKWLVGA